MAGLKNFDWRSLKKLASPQAASDLNDFLEKLPQRAGQYALIAAGIAWMAAAGFGLLAMVKVQELTAMRAELKETEALQPAVPSIRNMPVNQSELRRFVSDLERTYPNLVIKQQGSSIFIAAGETTKFGAFREAIGHVQNGGSGWQVSVDKLCVGRECRREKLSALLRINKVTVEKPQS